MGNSVIHTTGAESEPQLVCPLEVAPATSLPVSRDGTLETPRGNPVFLTPSGLALSNLAHPLWVLRFFSVSFSLSLFSFVYLRFCFFFFFEFVLYCAVVFLFFVFALSFDSFVFFSIPRVFFQELYYFQNNKVFFFFKNSLPLPLLAFSFCLFAHVGVPSLSLRALQIDFQPKYKQIKQVLGARYSHVLSHVSFFFVLLHGSCLFFFEIFSDSFHVLVIPFCMFRCSHVPFSFIFVFLHTFCFFIVLISHVSFVVIRLTSHLQLDVR